MTTDVFQLIIVTSENDFRGEDALITELFEEGLQVLHIRKPAHQPDETRKLLQNIPQVFHSKIVVHNHYELIKEFNLKGAHLPEKKREQHQFEYSHSIVSTSFHTLNDILTNQLNLEYVFLSPVFHSISKQDYIPTINIKELSDFFNFNGNLLQFPIIALGGITDENILQTKEIGFKGAACIGFIWENQEPLKHFKKLQKKILG